MVYVVLYYYLWCVKLYGCCGSVLVYVWCRIKWLLWYCITIRVVQNYMVTVVIVLTIRVIVGIYGLLWFCITIRVVKDYMVTVVLYYYMCGEELNGYCGTVLVKISVTVVPVLLYVWCKTVWLLWFCIV